MLSENHAFFVLYFFPLLTCNISNCYTLPTKRFTFRSCFRLEIGNGGDLLPPPPHPPPSSSPPLRKFSSALAAPRHHGCHQIFMQTAVSSAGQQWAVCSAFKSSEPLGGGSRGGKMMLDPPLVTKKREKNCNVFRKCPEVFFSPLYY